jgi:hypothetical protein
LGQTEKSAIAEHAHENLDHVIQYERTDLLASTTHYHARMHREAIEIQKHRENFNRKEEGMKINGAWLPVLRQTTRKVEQRPVNAEQPERRAEHRQSTSRSPIGKTITPTTVTVSLLPPPSASSINTVVPEDGLPVTVDSPPRRVLRSHRRH